MRVEREFAPAKVNLALHVVGRRPDGYHLLDSLVVFPRIGDTVSARPADRTTLALTGPFAAGLEAEADNLVLRAARLSGCSAEITLDKVLPVASGIGGGSADAAATLRLLARLHDRPLPDRDRVLALGADVPVCLSGRSCRMSGIGEEIRPVTLPEFWILLVNPRIPVSTASVFRALARTGNAPLPPGLDATDFGGLCDLLRASRNDLEAPALAIAPPVAEVLERIGAMPGCGIARMSGSGATCFGVFARRREAEAARAAISAAEPGWWVEAAPVPSGGDAPP